MIPFVGESWHMDVPATMHMLLSSVSAVDFVCFIIMNGFVFLGLLTKADFVARYLDF